MAVPMFLRALLRAPLRQQCQLRALTISISPRNSASFRNAPFRNVTSIYNVAKVSNCFFIREYSRPADQEDKPYASDAKLTLFQRFKQMYKEYWYVLVPVHLVTSAFWFGGFYYMAKSGIDIVAILESWNVSEKITNTLKGSEMGNIAVSYALYKIFTPLRYTVTLGGTTLSIKYLKEWGYIKPVPTTQQLKNMYELKRNNIIESMNQTREMYKERRETIQQKMKDTKEELLLKKEELKTKKEDIMGNFEDTLKNIHEETKKQVTPPKPEPVLRNLKGKQKS